MMWFLILQSAILILNVCSEDSIINYDEAFDPIVDMLLNSDRYAEDSVEESNEYEETKLINANGKWTCGDCDKLEEMKLIYNEVYEFDTNGYGTDEIDIQISVSLEEMRCVIVETETKGQVFRTAGTCFSEVTLRVLDSKPCYLSVYG